MGRNKIFKIFFFSVFIAFSQYNSQITVFPDFFYGDDSAFYEQRKDEFIVSAKYITNATTNNIVIVKHGITFSPLNVY